MNCKYLTRRSKKYKLYWFCRFYKKQIEIQKCNKCSCFEVKRLKEIKKKSSKLVKVEKKRFSILTEDMTHCYVCGKKKEHIHEIYGGRNRQVSMRNGFCIPICWECHDRTETDIDFDRELKRKCQKIFEEEHSRSEFLQLIDENYLLERIAKDDT